MLSIEDKKIILENRNIFLLIKNLLIETNSSDELRDQNNKMRKFSEQLLKEIVEIHSLRDENVKLKVANFELQQQLLESKTSSPVPRVNKGTESNIYVEVIDVG